VAIAIEREGRCKTTRCRGVLSAASTAGANRVPFGGRFGKTRLKPGSTRRRWCDRCGRPAVGAGDVAVQDRRALKR